MSFFHQPLVQKSASARSVIAINEISNSVYGTFELHDLLAIHTVSGSINITIVPQHASSSSRTPSQLRLSTVSGSIKVTMAPSIYDASNVIPDRIYVFTVESMSGSITADLVHNSQTFLSTMSGSINASLHPLGQPGPEAKIDLSCMSGSAYLNLQPSITNRELVLRTLSADFHGGSGGLRIRFPSTWEGSVVSQLCKGRVRHQWPGLKVLSDGSQFTAAKGNGMGTLLIWGSSMNVELVGEHPPAVPRDAEVPEEGERMHVVPKTTDVREGGERVHVVPGVPGLPRGAKVQGVGERVLVLPERPKVRQEEEENDDDWTVIDECQ